MRNPALPESFDKESVEAVVEAVVHFTLPMRPLRFGLHYHLQFGTPPKLGDTIRLADESETKLPEELRAYRVWVIVEMSHSVDLSSADRNLPDELRKPVRTQLKVTAYPLGRSPD